MILTTTTQKLQIILGAAVATNQARVVVDYVDMTTTATTAGVQASNTNSTTAVDILAAPSASTYRKVNAISVCNYDTANISITIRINDNSTLYPVVTNLTLAANSTLQFTDGRGWYVINSAGQILNTNSPTYSDVQIFTSASGTWTKPAGVSMVYVECVGGGGAGGGGRGQPVSNTKSGGGGGGGGKRTVAYFNAGDLPSSPSNVSITVAQAKTGANGGVNGDGANGSAGDNSSFGTYLIAYGGGGGAGATATSAGAGGGGGGGTSAGTSATSGAAVIGGAAFAVSVANNDYATDIGAPSGGAIVTGRSSYLGGGGGAGGSNGSSPGSTGGSSGLSAGAGGGGGGVNNANPGTLQNAGAGGNAGWAATAAGGGGTAGSGAAGGNGATGDSTKCGAGGGGGGGNNAATGYAGGDGGFPGGGGGGGGGGTSTGGAGGNGAAGRVVVYSW